MKKLSFTLIAVLPLFFLWGSAFEVRAQFPQIESAAEFVSWESSSMPAVIAPGGRMLVAFDAVISGDWKMYALDSSLPPRDQVLNRPYGVSIEWASVPDGMRADTDLWQSDPEENFDPYFDMTLKFFHKQARFVASVRAEDDAVEGLDSLVASLRYQICSDELGFCLRPTTVSLAVNVRIDSACEGSACTASDTDLEHLTSVNGSSSGQDSASGASVDGYAGTVSSTSDYEQYRSRGLLAFLMLAVGAGLASLLTPCVFPMIPLTVSYFTKHAHDRGRAIRMASLFGASIIVTFASIGIVAALVVGAAGAQQIASNPWVNLFIAIVLVGFALSLLGMFELRLPNGMINYFDRQGQQRAGWVGVVFMGLTLTLVSFSCTAPFVGGLLAAASGGTWLYPLLGMVVYSTTFALPFILFALFPNALSALPKSGTWMNVSKVTLGFIELAAAVKFLSNADLIWEWGLISRPLGISFIVVVFFLAGLYLLGKLNLLDEPPVESLGVGRMMASSAFFVLALYMIPGLFGASLNSLDAYLPPRQATDPNLLSLNVSSGENRSSVAEAEWIVDDIDAAFALASQEKKPVLVDFTGYTCTNCREMEANVFTRRPIVDRFDDGFVLLRLYTDGLELGDSFNQYQLRLTGTVALPTYAIVDPDGERLIARESGVMDIDDFGSFLDRASATFYRAMKTSG